MFFAVDHRNDSTVDNGPQLPEVEHLFCGATEAPGGQVHCPCVRFFGNDNQELRVVGKLLILICAIILKTLNIFIDLEVPLLPVDRFLSFIVNVYLK